VTPSPSPFSPRAVLALVLAGGALFVALLWAMGQGGGFAGLDNGGGHGRATGVNGFAGFARLLEADGWQVATAREENALRRPGLLVLTPPADAKGADIAAIVAARRNVGPTMVIAPKWLVETGGGWRHPGWVRVSGTRSPEWPGFLDDVGVMLAAEAGGWKSAGLAGPLPVARTVLSGRGARLMPLVVAPASGHMLAAALADDGFYPVLERQVLTPAPRATGKDSAAYPLVLVFEPDLLDNYGMANRANAELALALARALVPAGERSVTFDLTLNGLALPDNLLRLALTPPWLGATMALMLVAVALAWRAFVRFGPARAEARDIALGKAVLVDHAGALVVRSRRWHLLGGPYAALVRERIVRGLALPRGLDAAASDAAIDRALLARGAEAGFAENARALETAGREDRVLAAARALEEQARVLTR